MKKLVLLIVFAVAMQHAMSQAPRKVLIECMIGTWTGYSPMGITYFDQVTANHPSDVIAIYHHGPNLTYDIMCNSYTTFIDSLYNVTGLPSNMVDRVDWSSYLGASPTPQIIANYSTHNYISDFTTDRLAITSPVSIDIISSYNSSSRWADVNVTANFVGSASGDMRITCLLVEDTVTGGSAYSQNNYMGAACAAPDPSDEFYTYPCLIPTSLTGQIFYHKNVTRYAMSPPWGTAGLIPASVSAGQHYSQSYSYQLPSSGWNPANMKVVAFVSYYNAGTGLGGEVLNAEVAALTQTVMPGASFQSSDTNICANTCINYTDESTGNPTSWQWIFAGANPSLSTDQNPQNICYADTGSYDVTLIVSSNIVASDTLTLSQFITVNPLPAATITPMGATTFCDGDSVTLEGSAADCLWSTGETTQLITVSTSGNYTVTITGVNGCSSTSTPTAVTVNPLPVSAFSISADTTQLHHYIVTNNVTGIPPISYYWSWGDGTYDSIPYPTHTYSDSGFYDICLTITDSTGCTSTFCDSTFRVQRTTNYVIYIEVVAPVITGLIGINNPSPTFSIYPNPVTNELTIYTSSFLNKRATVSIRDMLGEIVQEEKVKWSNLGKLNIKALPVGIYFVQVAHENGIWVGRFVKE